MARANMRDLAIATVNLYNLHVPGGETYTTGKPPIPDDAAGREAYRTRILWLARLIERLDADVLCFQELWARKALEDVFAEVGGVGTYDLVARDAPGIGKPQVALAVRRDRHGKAVLLDGADWIADFPAKFHIDGVRERHGAEEPISISIRQFSRPVLRARIQPEGRSPTPPPVTIFVAHLKSKGPARLREVARGSDTVLDHHYALASSAVAHTRRVLEAGALRAMLDAHMTSIESTDLSPTIVAGDLNDATLSVSTELLTGQPSYRLFAKTTAGSSADKGLYSVETLQQYRSQRHVYYTYIYKNKMESLDHILVSEEFYDHSRKRQWSFYESEVYNDHLNTSEKKDLKDRGAIDHGVVRSCFQWNPMEDQVERIARTMQD